VHAVESLTEAAGLRFLRTGPAKPYAYPARL